MSKIIIDGTFTTRSPLSHIGESVSIGSLLNERPIIQQSGDVINVFCYNANAWRGQLRDLAALYLIKRVEIEALKTESHNFLFSGGKIGGASKFDVAKIRNYMTKLPIFSLFGGCLDNMMLPGSMSVMDALPICQEAMTELPDFVHRDAVENTYKHMTIEREFTRMDDAKNMKLNQTISQTAMSEKETTQMRTNCELLNSGVQLYSRIFVDDKFMNIGVLCSALLEFSEHPFIGGQHNKGHGKVDLNYKIDGETFFSVTDISVKKSDIFNDMLIEYNSFLYNNKEEIKELLS